MSSVVGFYYKKRDRKEKKVMVKLVDLNYLFISSSISVGKGKLIPNEKKKKKYISEWPNWLEDMLII